MVGAAGMTTKVSQRAGEPARHGAAPKAAAGERPPSAKGGYKPRRGGVRLEGHIDHILRRRIVLCERELIPKGLRPEVAAADSSSLGSVCQPGKWDGFGAPFGSQLHGVPGAGFHPLWGPGTSQGAAVGSLLDSWPSPRARNPAVSPPGMGARVGGDIRIKLMSMVCYYRRCSLAIECVLLL